MLFSMYLLCSVLPVIGHILVGIILGRGIVGDVFKLQFLTLLPIVGPVIAIFYYGIFWAVGLFVFQLMLYSLVVGFLLFYVYGWVGCETAIDIAKSFGSDIDCSMPPLWQAFQYFMLVVGYSLALLFST